MSFLASLLSSGGQPLDSIALRGNRRPPRDRQAPPRRGRRSDAWKQCRHDGPRLRTAGGQEGEERGRGPAERAQVRDEDRTTEANSNAAAAPQTAPRRTLRRALRRTLAHSGSTHRQHSGSNQAALTSNHEQSVALGRPTPSPHAVVLGEGAAAATATDCLATFTPTLRKPSRFLIACDGAPCWAPLHSANCVRSPCASKQGLEGGGVLEGGGQQGEGGLRKVWLGARGFLAFPSLLTPVMAFCSFLS